MTTPHSSDSLTPLRELPRYPVDPPEQVGLPFTGQPGVRVVYTNDEGHRFTIDLYSEDSEAVEMYLREARVEFRAEPVEEHLSEVQTAFRSVIAEEPEEKSADAPYQESQADEEAIDLRTPGIHIVMNWDNPDSEEHQRVWFTIDPSVTFFRWNNAAAPPYDVNAVHSHWKIGVKFISASVSTSSGGVDATLQRNGSNVSPISAAPVTVGNQNQVAGNYRLRIRGLTQEPNTYAVTGTWEV